MFRFAALQGFANSVFMNSARFGDFDDFKFDRMKNEDREKRMPAGRIFFSISLIHLVTLRCHNVCGTKLTKSELEIYSCQNKLIPYAEPLCVQAQ